MQDLSAGGVMARISELYLENFQGVSSRQTLGLGSFTLVFGENSAGKSSAARALLLLSQSLNERRKIRPGGLPKFLSFVGPQIDLASFSNVVHRHDDSLNITIGIRLEVGLSDLSSWSPTRPFSSKGNLQGGDIEGRVNLEALSFEVTESQEGLRRFKLGFTFFFEGKREGLNLDLGFGEGISLDDAQETSPEATKAFLGLGSGDDYNLRLINSLDFSMVTGWPSIPASRTHGGEPIERQKIESSMDRWLRSSRFFIGTALAAPYYVPGIRPIIQRVTLRDSHDQESAKQTKLLQRRNSAVNRYLSELTDGRYQIERLTQNLGDAGFLGEVEVRLLRDTFLDVQVSFQDVGFGLGQILPVLTGMDDLRFEAGDGLMIVEQPELHLHPKMQAELAQLMFESTTRGGQVIAETHSEAMLLRVQKILRQQFESKKEPASVSVIYVSFDPEHGSTFKNMELRSDMDFILDFPSSFSELRLSELS